jgi:hypothetical protein
MAAFTTIAAISIAAVATAAGTAKAISAGKDRKKALKAIRSYKRQGLSNAYDRATISTLGSDLRREESARGTATAVEALRQSGTRGLIGGLGKVSMQSNLVNRDIGINLDEQQQELDALRAQDEMRLRQMKEQRDNSNLKGLGNKYQQAKADQAAGIKDAISGATIAVGNIGGITGGSGGTGFTDAFGGAQTSGQAFGK